MAMPGGAKKLEILETHRRGLVQDLMLPADRCAHLRSLAELFPCFIGHSSRRFDVVDGLIARSLQREEVWDVLGTVPELKLHRLGGNLLGIAFELKDKESVSLQSRFAPNVRALRDHELPRVPVSPILVLDARSESKRGFEVLVEQAR